MIGTMSVLLLPQRRGVSSLRVVTAGTTPEVSGIFLCVCVASIHRTRYSGGEGCPPNMDGGVVLPP